MSGIVNNNLVALDSNIFIYNLEGNSEFVKFTDSIFKKLLANKLKAVTSIVSLIEILSFQKTSNVAKQLTEDLFSTPNLEVFDVNQEIAVEAAKIRREYGFRLPDAIQLATAKCAKTEIFITNDQKLKKFKLLKVILLKEV
ncbi:MAG: PilT protein-like protein [Candidatus Levybacteria bacterium GW2011_GWC2_37_7]|nr:MAG: PilT protein-like protein [Candidatus Levybacteria bacterium GW2011_GWC2_37_7]